MVFVYLLELLSFYLNRVSMKCYLQRTYCKLRIEPFTTTYGDILMSEPRFILNKLTVRNPKDRILIRMVRQRIPLELIGKSLKISKQAVSTRKGKIALEYGENVYTPTRPTWTPTEAATEIHASLQIILRLCAEGVISCRRRNSDAHHSAYLITQTGLKQLQRHPDILQQRMCIICTTLFHHKGTGALMCSDECVRIREKQLLESHHADKPDSTRLVAWRKKLWERLEKHSLNEHEEWVSATTARAITGLSKGQLVWLRTQHIVRTIPHPTRKWGSYPVNKFAMSEMRVVKEVFSVYLRTYQTAI